MIPKENIPSNKHRCNQNDENAHDKSLKINFVKSS